MNGENHYYLASALKCSTIIKEEIDGLTRVLIELKSQYDIILRESIDKKSKQMNDAKK